MKNILLRNIFNKYKDYKYAKHFLVIFGLLLLYIAYLLYIWSKTESTDNAYVNADISNVSSEINGVVTKVFISNNTKVEEGDLIAEIEAADYKAKLASIEASINASNQEIKIIEQKSIIANIKLAQGKEALDLAKTCFDIAGVDYARTKELNKDNFASNKILDNAKATYEKAKTEYSQEQLKLQIAEQELSLLRLEKSAEEDKLQELMQDRKIAARSLANTEIKAPVSGIFANSNLQVGNYVTPGSVLFSIVQNDKIYIQANFKETQVARMVPGFKVKIQFDVAPKQVIIGSIRNLSPATGSKFSLIPPDNATGNFTKVVQRVPVLIDFQIPKSMFTKLVPGMSATVYIRTDQRIK